MMLKFFYILTCAVGSAAILDSSALRKEFDPSGLNKVHVENPGGKVTIWPQIADQASVVVTWHRNVGNKCTTDIDKSGQTLIANIHQPSGADCEATMELRVPKRVDLEVNAGSGNVNIYGIEGTLGFKMGSGTLQAEGRFNQVAGHAGSGEVVIKGLTGGGSIESGSSQMKLSFLNELHGHLQVNSGSGSAVLLFPKGSKISAKLDSRSGAIENEVGNTASATFGVSMNSGSGNLRVKSY
jgi:hypothetical protein